MVYLQADFLLKPGIPVRKNMPKTGLKLSRFPPETSANRLPNRHVATTHVNQIV